jgi:serine/threonine protein kinase
MAFVHRRGFVHGSLDPTHIFLDVNHEVRIGDFRCAGRTVFQILPRTSPWRFLAPEYRNRRYCTSKIDVFAFGITLYLMWASIPLRHPQLKPLALLDWRAHIPYFYWDLITACWADDPEERPSFEQILALLRADRSWVFPGTDATALAAYEAKVLEEFWFVAGLKWTPPTMHPSPLPELLVDVTSYRLEKRLGEGIFGIVHEAIEIATGARVALKKLKWGLTDDNRTTFLREIEILSAFRHPTLLKLCGCRLTEAAILTELLPGVTLQSVLNRVQAGNPPPEWDETRKLIVLYGIATGMSILHANRVFHRDLKPENVMLTAALEPKIADFGLAKVVDVGKTLEQSGAKGTPLYMAPEVYLSTEYGFPADVYAFGVIAYSVLTGLPVFPEAKTPFAVGQKVTQGERPPLPDDLPPHYCSLINACWAQAPEERPTFHAVKLRLEAPDFVAPLDVAAFHTYFKVCNQCQD